MEGLFNLVMTHLSVVIPVYNESSLIHELIKRVSLNVKKITENYEIIIVNDGPYHENDILAEALLLKKFSIKMIL